MYKRQLFSNAKANASREDIAMGLIWMVLQSIGSVSYTHLDVYKRQKETSVGAIINDYLTERLVVNFILLKVTPIKFFFVCAYIQHLSLIHIFFSSSSHWLAI